MANQLAKILYHKLDNKVGQNFLLIAASWISTKLSDTLAKFTLNFANC